MSEIESVVATLRQRAATLTDLAVALERLAISEKLIPTKQLTYKSINDNTTQQVAAQTKLGNGEQTITNHTDNSNATVSVTKTHTRTLNRGLRATILRYLSTGGSTAEVIASVLDQPATKINAVLSNLVNDSFALKEQHTIGTGNLKKDYVLYVLTDSGMELAKWFVNNPGLIVRNKQALSKRK